VKGLYSLFRNKLFLLCVFFPTLIASVYFGLIASDVYISESSFVIRTPEKQSSSALGLILKGAGFTRSQDDAYTVEDYIKSRDAMNVLNHDLGLKEKFSAPNVDWFSRFGGLDWHTSMESFHKYYLRMLGVNLDPMSSIITLHTKAYTAEDAQKMNALLLLLSEKLVNEMNERGQNDLVQSAQREVDKAEVKAKAAALTLGVFRNRMGVIDPERQTQIPLQQIAKLQDQLMATNAQILQIQTVSKNNPQLPSLRQRAQLIQTEIDRESAKITGSGKDTLASKAVEYQRLSLDSQFADRALISAMSSLEQARNEAQRQQLFLERISQPSLPDKAMEPKRARAVLAVFIFGLVLWGILSMLIAGVREHQD
jgi:capsular polysaccharide transport system permease protein